MSDPLRLGILATHPIQYHAPLFRELAARQGLRLTVYLAHRPEPAEQGAGFGVPFEWDLDLTSGYEHVWLRNVSRSPSATTFRGCDTPEIGEIIARERFDSFLVMGWHARTYWQAMVAGWRSGTPLLVRGDSQLAPGEPTARRLLKRALYPTFLGRMAACLSVGARSDEYFRMYGAQRVVRSPHFVDNEFFAARAATFRRRTIRAGWGIADDSVVFLFAGKLVIKKRPLDLVRGLARVRSRRPVVALFVGDGALRGACEEEARALGVEARFTGFLNQTEIPRAYAACDALVLPSDAGETWGLVVNEAMASGRPAVVADAVGCSPDLVLEGRTGSAFPVGDVAALAVALERLAEDPGAAAQMGEQARAHVQSFSAARAADGVLTGARVAAECAA